MENFNTSHVSINLSSAFPARFTSLYFNTSHVSINHFMGLCCGIFKQISIHLMFLLICWWEYCGGWINGISIHLMFLLIYRLLSAFSSHSVISIHLMFLLIPIAFSKVFLPFSFQYISCFY